MGVTSRINNGDFPLQSPESSAEVRSRLPKQNEETKKPTMSERDSKLWNTPTTRLRQYMPKTKS